MRSIVMAGRRSVDWSTLPSELLHLIAKSLPDISDFVRFRAVCQPWRSAASVADPPSQIPWLLERRESLTGDLRFYSPLSGQIHAVHCASSSNSWLKGPAHDYVLCYNSLDYALSLLNPVSNNEVALPYLDITGPRPVKIDPDPVQIGKDLVLSGNSADFTTGILAFYQPIENKWIVIEEEWSFHYHDAYHNGLYYINEIEAGIVKIMDVNTKSIKYTVPPPVITDDNHCYLFPSSLVYLIESNGEILRVFQHDEDLLSLEDCHFHIHRLDFTDSEKPCWVEIDSIGERILFLDLDNGFSLCADDLKGFKGNCIYFTKLQSQDIYEPPLNMLCRYDVEERRTEALDCPFAKGGTWIVPSLR